MFCQGLNFAEVSLGQYNFQQQPKIIFIQKEKEVKKTDLFNLKMSVSTEFFS